MKPEIDCYSKYINTFRRHFLGKHFVHSKPGCTRCGIPLEKPDPGVHERPYGLWFCSEKCTREHAAEALRSTIPEALRSTKPADWYPFICRWDPVDGWSTFWPAIRTPLLIDNAPSRWKYLVSCGKLRSIVDIRSQFAN